MVEKDLVWDELELDDLLDLGRKSLAAQQAEAQIIKSNAHLKQQKLLKKPGFNVLIDRYNSLPSKPKAITMSKLAQLADPIIGRLTNAEKKKYQSIVSKNDGYKHIDSDDPRIQKVVLSINEEEGDVRFSHIPQPKVKSKAANYDGFFMTEAIPEEDDSFGGSASQQSPKKHHPVGKSSIQSNNIKSSKNGFASLLRNRVHDAKKVSKLAKPLNLYKGRSDDLDESVKREELTNAYKQRLSKLKKANKEIYERNKITLKKAKDKRASLGLESSMSESSLNGKSKKVGVIKDPKTGRIKKVAGSGYGKLVQRFTNQPKARVIPKRQKQSTNDTNPLPTQDNTTVSDITPVSTTTGRNPPSRKVIPKVQSLGVIEEDPVDAPKPLSKKLSSSSAPHINRKSKPKLPALNKASDISAPQNNSSNVDTSTNQSNNEAVKKRTIRSAGAVRISTDESEEAAVLMKIVEAKRRKALDTNSSEVTAKNYPPNRQNSSISPSNSPSKQSSKLSTAATKANNSHLAPAALSNSPLKTTSSNLVSPSKVNESDLRIMESNIQDLLQRDQSKITDDIAASIQKLQQFEKSIISGDMYTKPDANSNLVRRAEKLGSHLTAAESILADYESMMDF